MNKEELDKEATEYALKWGDKTDGTYACCRDGYLAGAEPREKRIAELEKELEQAKKIQVVEHFEAYGQCRDSRKIASLEKENTELKDKLKNLESVAEVRLANWQKYEEENKELKAINEGYCRSRDRLASIGLPTFMSCKETVNKLKEAKEIIRNLLRKTYGEDWIYSLDVKVEAEQFIKENNNEQART